MGSFWVNTHYNSGRVYTILYAHLCECSSVDASAIPKKKIDLGRGVQKTCQPAKPDPTRLVGLGRLLGLGGLGWVTKFFL